MEIRKAQKEDLPQIVKLLHEEDLQLADGTYFDEGLASYLKDLFFVAIEDNEIIGTVFGEYIIEGAIIWEIAVNPKNRNQGIGNKLLVAFETEVISNKKDFILLYSSTKENVYKFYKNRGYTGNLQFIEMKKTINQRQLI